MRDTLTAVGTSSLPDPRRAAKQAVEIALSRLQGRTPDLVMVFATAGYEQPLLIRTIHELTGRAPMTGCSGEGIISNHLTNEDAFGLLVAVFSSDRVRFTTAHAVGLKNDSTAAGRALGDQLAPAAKEKPVALILLPDGLSCNFDRLEQGLARSALASQAPSLPLFGGTSGDAWEFRQTYQYFNGEVFSDSVSAVLVSGEGGMAYAVNHGCVPVGGARTITRAEGNVIYEIDGRPTLDVLREYADWGDRDDWQKTIVNLAIGFEAPRELAQHYDELIIRFIPQKDDARGSISIPTEVKAGTRIWMTRRDHEKVSRGLKKLASEIREQLGGKRPDAVFHFDCGGRGKVIFRLDEREQLLKQLQNDIGPDIPWIGFHSYGEIGPVGGHNLFHNYTAVIGALHS